VQTTSSTEQQRQDPRVMNGMTYDEDDTTQRGAMTGHGPGRAATTEQNVREHMRQRQADQDTMDYDEQRGN
jgi:hypothetical protein